MAKGTSFADKSKGKKKINKTFVKYVKSIKSEKTVHWSFNEQMVGLNSGENLDGALKRIQEEALALDLVLPSLEEAVEQTVEEQAVDEAPTPEETTADSSNKEAAEAGEAQEEVVEEDTEEESAETAEEVVDEEPTEVDAADESNEETPAAEKAESAE